MNKQMVIVFAVISCIAFYASAWTCGKCGADVDDDYKFCDSTGCGFARPERIVARVIAKLGGREVDGAKLNDGAIVYETPVVWTLKKGRRYGPYEVSYESGGHCWTGRFNAVTADWTGQKMFIVPLKGYVETEKFKRQPASSTLPMRNNASEVRYKFSYSLDRSGNAILRGKPCIKPNPVGELVVPDVVDGRKVVATNWDAFRGCDKLTKITLPETLKDMGGSPFIGATLLDSIEVSKTHPYFVTIDGALYTKNRKELQDYPKTRDLIKLVPGVSVIRNDVFASCKFSKAKLPEGITYVGDYAFVCCKNLEIVEFPKSLGVIGFSIFADSPKLKKIVFHGDAPRCLRNPICGAPRDAVIYVRKGSKGWNGQGKTSLPERWPTSGESRPIRYIDWDGQDAAVRIESDVNELAQRERGMRAAAEYLSTVPKIRYKFNYKIENGNAVLCRNGNNPCVSPKPVGALVVPDVIEGYNVTRIDTLAFSDCDQMTSIVLPAYLEKLPTWISGWGVPGNIFSGCQALTHIGVSAKNSNFISVNGALYSKDKTKLIAYPKDRKDIRLCPETTIVDGDAFNSCTFKVAKVPEGVKWMGCFVFSTCPNLEVVEYPKSIECICHRAFFACPKMRRVIFNADAPGTPARNTRWRENLFCQSSGDIIVEVKRGTKGWNGKGSTDLPERWPLFGSDSRPIRYMDLNGPWTEASTGRRGK